MQSRDKALLFRVLEKWKMLYNLGEYKNKKIIQKPRGLGIVLFLLLQFQMSIKKINIKTKIFFTSLFAISILCFGHGAQAATKYVNSSTGNDTTGDGSSGAPYKTFYKGYTQASSGDTLNLTGTFSWTDADETGDSAGTGYNIAKNLTIQGQGADETIIQANAVSNTADRSVFYISATVTIKNLTIRNGVNTSEGTGGGITNAGTLTLQQVRITGNRVNFGEYVYWGAGGVYTKENYSVTITNSTIDNNTYNGKAYGSGGVYSTQSATSIITGTTFNGNVGISSAPTTYAYSYSNPSGAFGAFRFCYVTITNCTFFNNSSNSNSGAIQIYYDYYAKITNSTIVGNSATYGAGGILYQSESDGYNLSLKNTIIANNTGVSGAADDFYAYNAASGGRITDNGYNIVETSANKTWSGTGNITGEQSNLNIDDELLDNSSIYGPDTLALLSGSVAINAGDSAANSGITIPTNDQRGAERVDATDIGAYEYSVIEEPITQASEVIFSSVGYNQATIDWTNGNGSKRAVFVKQADSGTASPSNNTTYTASATFGSGTQIGSSGWYCVYNGTGDNVTITGLSPLTSYIVQVFEYNGSAGFEVYKTDSASNNPNDQATAAFLAPTVQASDVVFSSVSTNQMTIGWTGGNGEKRAVFVKQADSGTASPSNNTTYTASATFGSGTQIGSSGWYCVYNGTGTSVAVTGLSVSTTYIAQVFEYNGSAGTELYFSASAGNNPKTQSTTAAPTGDDFETGNFSGADWTFGGNATSYQWTITSTDKYAGTYSAKAGAYHEAGKTSSMQITLNVQAGNISFYKKVSSESGYDYLKFYIDDVLQSSSWSGSVAWSQSTYAVSAGSHTFRWTYSKDGSVDSGSDTAWVDNIIFPNPADSTAPTITSISSDKANGSYKTGEIIDIDVNFSEAVTSTGNVTVTLETGDIDRTCTFSMSNSTTGTCNYTVQEGDNSADLNATISGTIKDQANNSMSNFTPSATLASNKALIIDTTPPSTPSALPAAGTYTAVQSVALSSSGSSAIYYTTDGSAPTTGSNSYSSAISVGGSMTIKALAVDLAGNESEILESAYVINLDTDAPVISNIEAVPSTDSVEITWETNEDSSSLVQYGLVSTYGSTTAETNTSPRVQNHNVEISDLQSCARYYYRVKSKDADNNQGVSGQSFFDTTGCNLSSITESNGDEVDISGGSVSLNTDEGAATITAPNNFYAETITIQINELNYSSVPTVPSGTELIEDNLFNFLAIEGDGEEAGNFDSPVSLVVNYGTSAENTFEESTLDVYKYAGGSWSKKNCILDMAGNTLTCSLDSFSTYGVFGQRKSGSSENEDDDDGDEEDLEVKSVNYFSGENFITIEWKTNNKADSKIKYGIEKNRLNLGKKENKKEKKHKMTLNNLDSEKTYYFRAYSKDEDGNEDSSKIYSIATSAVPKEPNVMEKEIETKEIPAYSGNAVPNVCSYIIQSGDSLWSVAKEVYGDATAYPLIIEKNKEQYPGIESNLIVGQELLFDCQKEEKVLGEEAKNNVETKENKKSVFEKIFSWLRK